MSKTCGHLHIETSCDLCLQHRRFAQEYEYSRQCNHDRIRTRCMAGVAQLDDDSLLVVDMVVRRFLQGREQYGPLNLNTDRRDWLAESGEELIDLLGYLAMALLKQSTPGRPGPSETPGPPTS